MQVHQNTFTGGLDTDTSLNKYSNDKYLKSENFRVIMEGENTNGAITNIDGNKKVIQFTADNNFLPGGSNLKFLSSTIIGLIELDKNLVVFVQHVFRSTLTYVFMFPLDVINNLDNPLEVMIDARTSEYRKLTGKRFGFTPSSMLRIVARKENSFVSKVYFTDGNQPLRVVNLSDPKIDSYSIDKFELVPNVNLTQPKFFMLGSGSLRVGRVQYSYQLYNLNGAETNFSPVSNLINLTKSTEGVPSNKFLGSELEENSGKSVQLTITNTDRRFDRIRVVRVLYESVDVEPSVQVFFEGAITDSTMVIEDSGKLILEEFTIEEFNELLINPIPKTIDTKNNYLFLGNVRLDYFDVDFNARAKRKNSLGEIYDGDFNPYNLLSEDLIRTSSQRYIYKDHTNEILGGEGENVSYRFITKEIPIDSYNFNPTNRSRIVKNISSDSGTYANSQNASLYVGYQRDEIYRFGLVCYDNKMRPSFVKWIDDIRFPDFKDEESYTRETVTSDVYDYVGYLKINLLPNATINSGLSLKLSRDNQSFIFNVITDDDADIILNATGLRNMVVFNNNLLFGNSVIITDYTISDGGKSIVFRIEGKNVDDNFRFSVESLDAAGISTSISQNLTLVSQGTTIIETVDFKYNLASSIPSGNRNITNANILGIEFEVRNLPSQVKAYQIVRAQRTGLDRTVIDLGLTSHITRNLTFERAPTIDNTSNIRLYEYTSPEHLVNNLLSVKGDRIETPLSISEGSLPNLSYSSNLGGSGSGINRLITYNYRASVVNTLIKTKIVSAYNHLHSPNEGLETFTDRGNIPNVIDGAFKGSTKIIETESLLFNTTSQNSPLISRRRRVIYPYGGSTISALNNTEYIACGDLTERGLTTTKVFNGDVYIGYFTFHRLLWNTEKTENAGQASNNKLQVVNFITESTLNLELLLSPSLNFFDNPATQAFINIPLLLAMQESRGAYRVVGDNIYSQEFDMYRYNSVYSQLATAKKFYPRPTDFQEEVHYPYRVHYSDKKVLGEPFDRWMKFRPNNFKDVDPKYREIIKLHNFKDNLFFFQPKGIGILGVEQRELIQTSAPGPLVAGLGDVISQPYYLSSESGSMDHWTITNSRSVLYYFDRINKKIARLVENGVEYISDSLNISSLMKKNNTKNTPFFIYDPEYNEIQMCLEYNRILIYNEYLNVFTGVHNSKHNLGTIADGKTYTIHKLGGSNVASSIYRGNEPNSRSLHGHPMGASIITLVINPQSNFVCVYDVLEFTIDMLNKDGVKVNNSCITQIRLYNEYQDTGNITLKPDENIYQKFRTWRFNEMFDFSEQDTPRLRSAYLLLDIIFNPTAESTKTLLHDVFTKYRANVKR